MNKALDSIQLNFNNNSLWLLNICLAIIMFGVALGIHFSDFVKMFKAPKPLIMGAISQLFLLPALTFLLVLILRPQPSIAMGMMLVAACPGGNISNFVSHMGGGNAALSVSLTGISTVMAIFMTPLNFEFWASLYPPTQNLLHEVSIDFMDLFKNIALILGIPLIIGLLINHYKPNLSQKMSKVLKPVSILIFAGFIVVAFARNMSIFVNYIHLVILLVFVHNALALATGFYFGKLTGLSFRDQKTLAIETGIQNSGLGLVLIFNFFNGLGGMALIAAWWGIWHIISGLGLAWFWSKKLQAKK